MVPDVDKKISDIFKRLLEITSRHETQMREAVSGLHTKDVNESES